MRRPRAPSSHPRLVANCRRTVRLTAQCNTWEGVTLWGHRTNSRISRCVSTRRKQPATLPSSSVTFLGRPKLCKYFPDVEEILLAWHERQISSHLRRYVDIRDQSGEVSERLEGVLEAYALLPFSDMVIFTPAGTRATINPFYLGVSTRLKPLRCSGSALENRSGLSISLRSVEK